MDVMRKCAALVDRVRQSRPLVHHLTNYVTVNDCAQITMAIGGSPIMATAIEEVAEIAAVSSAVVLNIGTLNPATVASMIAAGTCANARTIPVVFDPVGAGASTLRNHTTARIMDDLRVAVIRGNISEIRAAAGLASHTKGVDAGTGDMEADPVQVASVLARRIKGVVAVTGEHDAISDGERSIMVDNGHPMLALVSGTGCMSTSLTGAFVGADPTQPLLGATAALLCMGIAGEIAYERSGALGLGSFRQSLMDAVSRMDAATLLHKGRAREV